MSLGSATASPLDAAAPLHLLALHHRGPGASGTAAAGGREDLADAVLVALDRVSSRGGQVAVLVDDEHATILPGATARGIVPVVAVEGTGEATFAFAHGSDFARRIEAVEPALASARVRWHPDDHPDVKKEQALGLTKLAAWLHETDRRLLLELEVPPTEADLDGVGGDLARYASERRPELVLDAIAAVRQLGTEPDLWAIEGVPDRGSAAAVADLVRDAGRDHVGFLTLVSDLEDPTLDAALTAAASTGASRGFVLDRRGWPVTADQLTDPATRDAAIDTLAAAFTRLTDLTTAAPPA